MKASLQKRNRSGSPREAAFLAVNSSLKHELFVNEWLDKWAKEKLPAQLDKNLAQEIAFGASRMALSLDYIASKLSSTGKVRLKTKDKALLRTALYQACMMDRVPLYAIVDETVRLANKHCSKAVASFFNAMLRKLEKFKPSLPQGNTIEEISIRLSYPPFLVSRFVSQFGIKESLKILANGNKPSALMARRRNRDNPFEIVFFEDAKALLNAAASIDYYIQNATPAALFESLFKNKAFHPRSILDLCSSPGGKLLLAHDAFKEAALFANDVSEKKIDKLKENIIKYKLSVDLSNCPGESFKSPFTFDLIILDVPCSNTGVLNKRSEARWRISEDALSDLGAKAKALIANACNLLSPQGRIWYMTCSILEEENAALINSVCKALNLEKTFEKLILPDGQGLDGGYAAELKLKKN